MVRASEGRSCPLMERQMTHAETFAALQSQKDGPVKKFQLVKIFGSALRQCGHDPKAMSCAELEAEIITMLGVAQ
jgi:hypothetical protein